MTDFWFVAQTVTGAERTAATFLRELLGFEVYLPLVLQQRRHARRVDWVERPFIPGYIFVSDDGRSERLIRSARGIAGMMRVGERAARVCSGVIGSLRDRESGGYVVLDDARAEYWQFRRNEPLRVKGEALYSGYNVFYQKMSGRDRAEVFVSLLGRLCRAEIRLCDLERL